MRAELKIYRGEDVYSEESFSSESPTVNVRLAEMIRAIADAVHWNRTWLHDFKNDEIQVPSDLYEVITAYNHLRPSA